MASIERALVACAELLRSTDASRATDPSAMRAVEAALARELGVPARVEALAVIGSAR